MEQAGLGFSSIPRTAVKFISSPSSFYREMPKKGGYLQPLVFVVAMGLASGFIMGGLSFFGLRMMTGIPGAAGSGMAAGIGAITLIVYPIMAVIGVAIFGFIGAAILFVIWKLMGSEEDYETAYRCLAYATAFSPILVLIDMIPIAGILISMIIHLYLVVTASVEVHGLPSRKSWIVFGTIDAVIIAFFLIMGLSVYFMAKKFAPQTAGGPAFAVPAAQQAQTIQRLEEQMKTMSPARQAKMQPLIKQSEQAQAHKSPAATATSHAGSQPTASGAQNPALQQMDATIKAMEDRLNSLPPEQQVQMRRMIDQMKQARAKAASQ